MTRHDEQPHRPLVRNARDVAEHDGEDVTVTGLYQKIEMPSKVPSSPANPRPEDYAHIMLDDYSVVYLEPYNTPEARRPAAERAQFDSRRVRVSGKLYRRMPAQEESLDAPCVSEIIEIVADELQGVDAAQ
jgi:hypothetical protein